MNVYCQYSGVEYKLTGFGSTRLVYIHPIFSAEPKWLLSRMGDWAAQRFTEEESKLLFLALLHTTELVEFRATAFPDNQTVQLNMEQLARLAAWMLGISRPQLVLPKFVVSPENKKLQNVRYWIESWNTARKEFEEGNRKYLRDKALHDKEQVLERLIRSSTKKVEDYAGLLATWALQATGAPKALHEYWRGLFCLKGINIYNARKADLQELLEHMEEFLEHGSIFAASTLRHLRILVKKNAAGLNYGLGIEDSDLEEINTSPFTVVEGSVEDHNMALIAANAPVDEPQPMQFQSRVAYLRARAAWILGQRAKAYAAEFTQQVADEVAVDEEENNLAAENEQEDYDLEVQDQLNINRQQGESL